MGIIIAAVLTATLALACYGGVLFWLAPRPDWRWLALACALQLPMSAGTYYLVRRPLDAGMHALFGDLANTLWLRTLYAPLTEEPAKLWPLLIPAFARRVTRENAVRFAVALGLGFGVGEVGFLAQLIYADGDFSTYPWYNFTGFINERFMVCLIHGGFVTLSLCGWKRLGNLPLGLLGAMVAHFLGNVGITLAAKGFFGPNEAVQGTILVLWVVAFWVACVLLLPALNLNKPLSMKTVMGEAVCPECAKTYTRPFFAFNLGPRRYERCPHCKHWHMVPLLQRPPTTDAQESETT
jgi:hypothetical protein